MTPSAWILDQKSEDEFKEFVDLYLAYLKGDTANPEKLQLRVDRIWGALRHEKKKDWTWRLVKLNLIDENVKMVLDIFGGTITKFCAKPIPTNSNT